VREIVFPIHYIFAVQKLFVGIQFLIWKEPRELMLWASCFILNAQDNCCHLHD